MTNLFGCDSLHNVASPPTRQPLPQLADPFRFIATCATPCRLLGPHRRQFWRLFHGLHERNTERE